MSSSTTSTANEPSPLTLTVDIAAGTDPEYVACLVVSEYEVDGKPYTTYRWEKGSAVIESGPPGKMASRRPLKPLEWVSQNYKLLLLLNPTLAVNAWLYGKVVEAFDNKLAAKTIRPYVINLSADPEVVQQPALIDLSTEQKVTGPVTLGGLTPLVFVHGMEGREYFNRRDYERTGGQQGTPNTVWKLGIWDAFRGISTHLDRDSGEPLNPNSAEDTTQLATSFGKLADRYRLFAFTYPSYHRIPENGQELARQLGVAFPDAGSIVLVAHSMGGLVSRYAMNAPFGGEAARGLLGNKVAHLVTLATPHHGSLGESLSGYGRPLPDLAGSEMFRQGDEGSCWPLAVEPLAIVSGSLPQGSVGAAYGARLQALRATPVTWTVRGVASPVWSLAAGTLPVGLAVDPAGSVAGTPLQAAATVIQLGARNRGGSVTRPYELRFEAVELRETGLPAGDVGAAYEVRFFAAGRQPIDWSQGSGALPAGLRLQSEGILSGTPLEAGNWPFELRATNTAGMASRWLGLTVRPALAIPEQTLSEATCGASYRTALQAIGVPPFSRSGSAPAGLGLNSDGTVEGTPSQAGWHPLPVQATNAEGSGARELSLTIRSLALPSLTGAQAALPAGVVGSPYSGRLSASGVGPIAWSATSMPPGLNLAPDGSVLIEIPAGSFTMGQDGVATPVHQVTLSRYFIGKYEVTNAQYRAFLAATSDPTGPTQHAGHHPDEGTGYSHTPAGGSGVDYSPYSVGDNNPVVGVSWYDCYAYCAWAGLSLPTEAQWECAARGSDARTYPWGNDAPDAGVVYRANYNPTGAWPPDSNDGYQYAAPVGSFGAGAPSPRADGTSPFGALDMSGNVWEWARFFWHTARLLRSRASRAPFSGANPTPAR